MERLIKKQLIPRLETRLLDIKGVLEKGMN
jgi:hypothetical protein